MNKQTMVQPYNGVFSLIKRNELSSQPQKDMEEIKYIFLRVRSQIWG